MQVTYTAQELFEHIQSYNTVRFNSYQDDETLASVILDSSLFRLIKRGETYSIVAEAFLRPSSKVQSACCGICGNEFLCDVVVGGPHFQYEVINIKYGYGKSGIELVLEKF